MKTPENLRRKAALALVGTMAVAALCLAAGRADAGSPSTYPDVEGMVDLTVREEVLAHQWVVRDEDLPKGLCSVEEAGITPGMHRLLRFTVMTPNVGDADLVLGDPNVHVAANDGFYEYATCHRHFHLRNHTLYELVDAESGRVWRAAKAPFCIIDSDPNPGALEQPRRPAQFRSCGGVGVPGNQGLSHGWADTYRFYLGGQYIVLDGADGQEPVPAGDYLLRVTVNPSFDRAPGEPCPITRPQEPMLCRMIEESDYSNNMAEVAITIPDHPGKHGVGPMAGAAIPYDDGDRR
ncbi:MAG: lysyl oxidase family protein [Acidimicrobiales bacterium]